MQADSGEKPIEACELPPVRTHISEAKRDLDACGVARYSGAFTREELAEALQRLREQAAAEEELGIAYHDNGHVGQGEDGPNQRVWNLINKGEIFRRMVVHPAMLELARHLLGQEILLSSWTANIACQGAQAQRLHSDQWWAPEIDQALMANCFVMLTEFTETNGGTRVVPASHRSGQANPRTPHSSVAATGAPGTILAMDARTWHGTGANQTGAPRYGLLPRYCKPFVRQQENMTVSLSPVILSRCTPEFRSIIGMSVWRTFGVIGEDVKASVYRERPTQFTTELRPGTRAPPPQS